MKKVLSLVLAIVMMASVLVVSTSAASASLNGTVVGTSSELAVVAGLNAGFAGLNAAADRIDVTLDGVNTVLGTKGKPVSFYIDITDVVPTFNSARDYVTVAVTKGYSLVSMTTAIHPENKNLMLVTLTPVAGSVVGGEINVAFTHYQWGWTNMTFTAGKYTKQTPVVLTFGYDIPTAAGVTAMSDAKGDYYFLGFGGSLINEDVIKTVKGKMLLWTVADAVNPVGVGYDVAVCFPKVANLTPCNLDATVTNAYEGIDAPIGTMKVVDFVADTTLADAAMVSVVLDYDFLNKATGKDVNVYFVEEVEGASTTVKGAKVTFVGKATVGRDTADNNTIASFQLLNNKLGTYIVTTNTLSSDAAEEAPEATPEVPNVNTGADNAVNAAIVLAVLALAAAGFVAVKKVK